jgi:uncharacterized protein (TIGR04255 family)
MADFQGRLANAPVVYVLCQIRFSPIEKMADYVPAIQEALRPEYPNFEREQLGGISLASAQPMFVQNETRWRFESRDNRTGFMLFTNQLIAHTTNYVDSDDFRSRIIHSFKIIHQIAKLSFIQRIGLRYVDLITPISGDPLEKYVQPSLLGFRPQVSALNSDISQQFLRTNSAMGGTMLVKMSRAHHQIDLPADLLPTPLEIVRRPNPQEESIFLDWDHFIEQLNMDPDPDLLEMKLRELKQPIAHVFKEAITDYAVQAWQRH